MRIIYFGFYNPLYSRNRVILKALREQGVDIIECSTKKTGIAGAWDLIKKHYRFRNNYDLMVVGFPGQEAMFLAKILSKKPILFDAFTSHFGGYILDRQYFGRKSFRAFYYRMLDRWSCKLADLVLLDTDAHIGFFVQEFGLPCDKFKKIFVGTDTEIFNPKEAIGRKEFIVHFHGYYIPLQGVKYIIEAAKLLENNGIVFNLIGRGQTQEADKLLAEKLKVRNVNFIDKVDYEELPSYINKSEIALGIFGDTPKTNLVIPNKVYEALAMKKPVVTARTEAVRELLQDEESVVLCNKADPQDLASKILKLKDSIELRDKIAQGGFNRFIECASTKAIGKELIKVINERFIL